MENPSITKRNKQFKMKKLTTLLLLFVTINVFSQSFEYVKFYKEETKEFTEEIKVHIKFQLISNNSNDALVKYDRLIVHNERGDDFIFPYRGEMINGALKLRAKDKRGIDLYVFIINHDDSIEFLINYPKLKYVYGIYKR